MGFLFGLLRISSYFIFRILFVSNGLAIFVDWGNFILLLIKVYFILSNLYILLLGCGSFLGLALVSKLWEGRLLPMGFAKSPRSCGRVISTQIVQS